MPGPLLHFLVHHQRAGAEREVVIDHLANLVRARNHGEPTELFGAIAHGRPARVGVKRALEVHEVLVRRRGVVGVLREPDARNFHRVRQHRRVNDLLHGLQNFRPVPGLVKLLQLVRLVIHVGVAQVALGALGLDHGNALHRVGAGLEPTVFLQHLGHCAPQGEHVVRVEQAPEEYVTLGIHPCA